MPPSDENLTQPAGAALKPGAGMIGPGLLAVLTLVFFGDLFLGGKTLGMRDTVCDFLPWQVFAAKSWLLGQAPLWNPFCGFGKPFAADPRAAVFYPPSFLFCALPGAWALKISWAAHLWIAAASMFALARYWQLETVPALLAAVSFAFGTLLIGYMEFLSAFTASVWGPLVLLLVSRLMDAATVAGEPGSWKQCLKRSSRPVALLALVLGAQYLAGHPEAFLQTLMMAAFLIFLRSVWLKNGAVLARSSALFVLAGMLMLLLVLPQFLSSWELTANSERAQSVDPEMGVASVHPKHLLTLFLPFLFGNSRGHSQFWGATLYEFWAGTCYVGLMPLVTAVFAALYLRRRTGDVAERRKFIGIFALVMVSFGWLMASGQYTPVYRILHDHLPVLNRTRWPSKFLSWVPYGLALLGGLGYQAVIDFGEALRERRHRLNQGAVLVFLLAGGGYILARGHPGVFQWLAGARIKLEAGQTGGILADYAAALVFLAASLAVPLLRIYYPRQRRWVDAAAVGVLFLNLAAVSRQIQPVMSDAIYQGEPEFVQRTLRNLQDGRVYSIYSGSQFSLYGNRDETVFASARAAGMGDAWLPFGIHQLWQGGMKLASYQRFALFRDERGQLSNLGGLRYVVFDQRRNAEIRPDTAENLTLVEHTNALPRVYAVSRWTQMTQAEEILPRLASAAFDPRGEAVVESVASLGLAGVNTAAEIPAAAAAGAAQPGSARLLAENLNSLEIEADVKNRALLVLTDAWYPGWEAAVDGQPHAVYRVNSLYRGVFLEAGAHKIHFGYKPWTIYRCAWFSLFAGLALVFMLFAPRTVSEEAKAA